MTVKAFLLTPFILVAGLTWGLGFYVWRRSVPGIKAFGLMMVTLGAWSFFYFFELLSNDLSTAIFWINLEYIAVFSVPLLLTVRSNFDEKRKM